VDNEQSKKLIRTYLRTVQERHVDDKDPVSTLPEKLHEEL
jgi:hypothetical protein